MSLQKQLQAWVGAGLITAPQGEAIAAFEKRAARPPWALYGVAGIGVTALVAGVISLIAANWDGIPAAVKLGLFFLMEGGVGALFVRQQAQPGMRREVALTLFMLFILAGIGLIAQIFNIHSNGWSGLLFWLALSLPVTLMAESRLAANAWFAGLATMLTIWGTSGGGKAQVAVTAGYAVAAVGLAHLPGLRLNEAFKRAALNWGMTFVVFGLTLAASVAWSIDAPAEVRAHAALPWAGCALAAGIALLATPPYAQARRWRLAIVATLVSATAFYTLPLLVPLGEQPIGGAVCFLIVWSCAGVAAVAAERQRLFDVISFFIAARFVAIYFEVLGTLAATGIGLIVSGLVILGAVTVWYRFRRKVAALAVGGRA